MVSMQKAIAPAMRQGFALQAAAATHSARALSSTAVRSLTNSNKRGFSQSTSHGAPGSSILGITGPGGPSMPTSYFQKPSLPANTVVRFVPQQTAWLVERMGKFNRILEPGLAVLIPFIDRIAYVKSLKEIAIEIPSQSAITADNVTLELDGVLYTRVFDAYKARYVLIPHGGPYLLTSRFHGLTTCTLQLRSRRRRIRHFPARPDNNAERDRPIDP